MLEKMERTHKHTEVAQSCPTLCDPMDCSPPGSSVHGIFQAWILEWVAVSFSNGENREPLYTVGETGNWHSRYGRLDVESSKN